MYLILWDLWKLKYSHLEDLIWQFLCGSRLYRSLLSCQTKFCGKSSESKQIIRADHAQPRLNITALKTMDIHLPTQKSDILYGRSLVGRLEKKVDGHLKTYVICWTARVGPPLGLAFLSLVKVCKSMTDSWHHWFWVYSKYTISQDLAVLPREKGLMV